MSDQTEGSVTAGSGRGMAPEIDTRHAHPARIYNYWLGGKDNYAADREAAEQAIAANPGIVTDVRANRAFLARAVRYLAADCGIRQFLDIGTGLPTASNTHEVAQAAAPDARVVYVDNDPIVLSHARALLASTPEGATAYLDADLRDISVILDAAAQTLDFGRPIALMLLIILHLVPDVDDPYGIVAALVRALPAGSYLVLAHPASDIRAAKMAEMTRRVNQRLSGPAATMRDRAAITRFFDGLDLVEPGVVQPQQWRPEPGALSPPQVTAWCGVARKPGATSAPLGRARGLTSQVPETAGFLYEIGLLKRYKRTGWSQVGVPLPESVADHSFRASVIASVLAAMEGADPQRAAFLALWHDSQETRTTDIPHLTRDYVAATGNEQVTRDQVASLPPRAADMISAAVAEYEQAATPEARCARDADKLDCLLQAREYQDQGHRNVQPWIDSSLAALTTESAKQLAHEAIAQNSLDWLARARQSPPGGE